MPDSPRPVDLALHQDTRLLDITFDDGTVSQLSTEYLRVHSPSAEVKGHSPGQETLQTGKRLVNIEAIEPVGNYAVRLVFDDGHKTGIYSWDYLYSLAINQDENWQRYLQRLQQAGQGRDS